MSKNNEKEWTCNKCSQEVPLIKTDEKFAGRKTIIQVTLGNYEDFKKEGNLKYLYLCLPCWEKEKDKYLSKIREEKCLAQKNIFTKYKNIEDSDSAWSRAQTSYRYISCPFCQKWFFGDEASFGGKCSANCQKKYDALSFEEKESLTQQVNKNSNMNRSSNLGSNSVAERERERERERAKMTVAKTIKDFILV